MTIVMWRKIYEKWKIYKIEESMNIESWYWKYFTEIK
jgi:hypothetical protein